MIKNLPLKHKKMLQNTFGSVILVICKRNVLHNGYHELIETELQDHFLVRKSVKQKEHMLWQKISDKVFYLLRVMTYLKLCLGESFRKKKSGEMSFQTYSSRYNFFCKMVKCTTLYVDWFYHKIFTRIAF